MSTIDWPLTWQASAFELRIVPSTRTFTSPYSNATQVLDLGGERWRAMVTLQTVLTRSDDTPAREAMFDRLAGGLNELRLWHLWNTVPRGTLADAPVAWAITDSGAWPVTDGGSAWPITDGTLALLSAVSAGAQTATLQSRSGRTALAGDMVGIGGELKRVLADATANGAGQLTVTFAPRARADWAAYSTAIVTTRPTAIFQILGAVPTQWVPGGAGGASFEAVEVINL